MSNKNLAWPDSLWKATAESVSHMDCLPGDIDTDLLIIGAGYTGLSSALHFIDATNDIVIIDQVQPGWGCSGRNGGQVNLQWKPSLQKLQQMYPADGFNCFIDTLDQSARLVFDMIERFQINCDAVRTGSIIPARGERGRRYLTDWTRFWQAYGADVELLSAEATTDMIGTAAYDLCMLDHRGGSLQPLSYARGLARACLEQGVKIFGDTGAISVVARSNDWSVITDRGQINCKRLILGTNGYTDSLWPGLEQTIIPVASMITATKPLSADITRLILPDRQPVAEYAGVPAYYRIDESNRMVFGWRGTLYGGIGSLDTSHLKSKAVKLFPQLASADWEYDWAGYVGITSHQRPLLVKLGNNAYAGLGYNGRGITMATMMGKQLAKALNQESTSIPIEEPAQVPFHRFHSMGVASRIISGHVGDYLTTSA